MKFENPERVAELNPKRTLTEAGFKQGMSLCDIGAGTGIFTFAAAQISEETIFALDISDSMLNILADKKAASNAENVIIKKVQEELLPLENSCSDMTLMVTVLHEIIDQKFMLQEVRRISQEDARLVIIEFHKRETPIGPPVGKRMSEEIVVALCQELGFELIESISLGANFYALVFAV